MSTFLLWKKESNSNGRHPVSENFLMELSGFQIVFKLKKHIPLSSVQTSKSEEEIFKEFNLDLKSHHKGFQNIH